MKSKGNGKRWLAGGIAGVLLLTGNGLTALSYEEEKPQTPVVCDFTGEVWLDENGNGAKDAGERGIAGMEVRALRNVYGQNGEQSQDEAAVSATDEAGLCQMEGLMEGNYTVEVTGEVEGESLSDYEVTNVQGSEAKEHQFLLTQEEGQWKVSRGSVELVGGGWNEPDPVPAPERGAGGIPGRPA